MAVRAAPAAQWKAVAEVEVIQAVGTEAAMGKWYTSGSGRIGVDCRRHECVCAARSAVLGKVEEDGLRGGKESVCFGAGARPGGCGGPLGTAAATAVAGEAAGAHTGTYLAITARLSRADSIIAR